MSVLKIGSRVRRKKGARAAGVIEVIVLRSADDSDFKIEHRPDGSAPAPAGRKYSAMVCWPTPNHPTQRSRRLWIDLDRLEPADEGGEQ